MFPVVFQSFFLSYIFIYSKRNSDTYALISSHW